MYWNKLILTKIESNFNLWLPSATEVKQKHMTPVITGKMITTKQHNKAMYKFWGYLLSSLPIVF